MIDHAILLLLRELEDFIRLKNDPVIVTIDNIGMFETSKGDTLTDSIVITVVNIEEESTLKNQPALRRPIGAFAIYQNPPVYLNLYVLFTCNYSGDNYLFALKRLSYIIQFLQSKNSFSIASSAAGGAIIPDEPDVLELKFTMELYTLTFEQINHLWGSLGGRQMPFAMYKLRLVATSDHSILRQVPVIEEIGTELRIMD